MLVLADDASGVTTVFKVLLATVLLVLAAYQVLLITVGYGRIRLPFLSGRAASRAHRTLGDTLAAVALGVGAACVTTYEPLDAVGEGGREAAHVVAGTALLVLLAVKITVVRRGGRLGRFLPYLGTGVLALIVATWATSALTYLLP